MKAVAKRVPVVAPQPTAPSSGQAAREPRRAGREDQGTASSVAGDNDCADDDRGDDDGTASSRSGDNNCSDSDFEGDDGYRRGGYHPVHVGDVFNNRFVVRQKLGWGHFSTVWQCDDLTRPGVVVALKVQKSAEHYTEAAYDENNILETIARRTAEAQAALAEEATAEREAACRALDAEAAADEAAAATGAAVSAAAAERAELRAALAEPIPEAKLDTHIVGLVDHFVHEGPHGKREARNR